MEEPQAPRRGGGNTRGTRRGFGSVRPLPSGRFQARFTGPDERVYRDPVMFETKRPLTDAVIKGSYRNHQVQDDRVGGIDALEELALAREQRWRHVHLILQEDLAKLLNGESVPCRQIPRDWYAMKTNGRSSIRRGHP